MAEADSHWPHAVESLIQSQVRQCPEYFGFPLSVSFHLCPIVVHHGHYIIFRIQCH